MFVKIKFHGILKKLCPKVYEIDAQTPSEAIRGLTNQLPQLKRKDGSRFICRVKECPTKESLFSTFGDITELNIYPSFIAAGGGGNSGWLQVAIGAIIIVGAVLFTGGLAAFASFGAFTSTLGAMGGTWAGTFAAMGAGMMLSGFAQMLMPLPNTSNTQESQVAESRFFTHNQNTTAIGTRIALAYGKNKIYGQLLSFNTQAVDRGAIHKHQGEDLFESTQGGVYTLRVEKEGKYKVAVVGAGAACIRDGFLSIGGGSGAAFVGTITLKPGEYEIKVGEEPNEANGLDKHVGEDSYIGDLIIAGGARTPFGGFLTLNTDYISYEVKSNGNMGETSGKYPKGGKSLYKGHGEGGSRNDNPPPTGGYVKIERLS